MSLRAIMSSKDRIVVPKSVRDARGWKEGSELEFADAGGVVLQAFRKPDPRFPPVTWEEIAERRISQERPPVTIEDMDRAILTEAMRRWNAEYD